MTDKLIDTSRRSAFLDGAARLNAIARPGEQNGESPFVAAQDRLTAVSPDEVWNRRFMSMAIGPATTTFAATPPAARPEPSAMEERAPARTLARPEKPGPIGAAIGKPIRRSLLSRMFGRR
ncbi:MAG TPA: hypothetical protein VMH86_00515 [Rhizomicrobium sp.]|nr:hypothetical protein [Rhizomicrobium sp.]